MKAYLESEGTKPVLVESRCEIGRQRTCQIVLANKEVSRRHALLCRDRTAVWLIDLNSQNGTWLNGVKLAGPQLLQHGDRFRISSYTFTVRIEGYVPEPSAAQRVSIHEQSTLPANEVYAPAGYAAIVLDAKGGVESKSPEAHRLLTGFFHSDSNLPLPAGITEWYQGKRSRQWPLTIKRGEQRLMVRHCPMGDEKTILFLSEEEPVFSDRMLAPLGLSGREKEALRWIAAGKRNEEIAVILGISPRTAEKHVARLMQKLGAENRASAVSVVLQRLGVTG